jgi:di/tricarboxylate transporter
MSGETIFVFALIAVAAVLMASNRVRFDIVALLVVLALMLSGVLSVGEALSGFGNPVVILVAGLLVVGEMLNRTGVAAAMGDYILKKGGSSETRLLIVIMAGAALLGAVMSSTAVVAIFIPIVLRVAAETGHNASRMLMPMSYAALISGMLTLIATTPNLIVSEELKYAGYEGFGFFSFAPVGLAVLVVAILYILLIGRRLLPRAAGETAAGKVGRSVEDLWKDFRIDRVYESVQISPDSTLAGRTITEAGLESHYGVGIIGIMRQTRGGEERIASPAPDTGLQTGDTLLIVGHPAEHKRLMVEQALTPYSASKRNRQRWLWELGSAAVLIHPESELIGKSLQEVEFRASYGLGVFGVRRDGEPVADYKDVKLAASDSLFVVGPWSRMQRLQSLHHDFVVLEMPTEQAEVVPAYRRMPLALIILVAMVLLTIFDVVPLVAAVIMAAMAAGATRCLTMEDAYRAIHWSSLVLVAGMLPLADALEKTGGTKIIVDGLMYGVGDTSPRLMLTVIFFLTAALGLFLSNTASAVLVAPIAIIAAEALGVSPYPFAVAVLIAASAAFVTPVSTPVVTLVVEPGRYGFMDFVKVGVPLLLLTYAVTVVLAPLVFPFSL